MKLPGLLLTILLISNSGLAQKQQAVPYTLADRDRLIKLETELTSLRNEMNARFESIDKRFESIDKRFGSIDKRLDFQQKQIYEVKTLFYWGFGIVIALIIFMPGYMIWDRRTALKPAIDKASSADNKGDQTINILREFSQNHPDLANILRSKGLL